MARPTLKWGSAVTRKHAIKYTLSELVTGAQKTVLNVRVTGSSGSSCMRCGLLVGIIMMI